MDQVFFRGGTTWKRRERASALQGRSQQHRTRPLCPHRERHAPKDASTSPYADPMRGLSHVRVLIADTVARNTDRRPSNLLQCNM
eukprot:3925001-Amphidinium_carterae.1